ncbi:MAG: protein translocase subunit SecD [bacterium]|nr:protein translocase subunit SecD [bacterium]
MWRKSKVVRNFVLILALTLIAGFIALPSKWQWQFGNKTITFDKSILQPTIFGKQYSLDLPLKKGLDIAGGMQLQLCADMSNIAKEDRLDALESAVEVVRSRIDAYGVSEPVIQTAINGDDYRIIVELPGLDNTDEALSLIGTTAMMDFRLQQATAAAAIASVSATTQEEQINQYYAYLESFEKTDLTGTMLKKAMATFDPQTRQPVIALEFTPEGREIFADITKNNLGNNLGVFIDDWPVTVPRIESAIIDGNAIINGQFTVDSSRELAVQLNSGALPVPLEILQQRQVGASLGEDSISRSIFAGVVGLTLVCLFMILIYGTKGIIADIGLVIYSILIIAIYKIFGVTLTLPSIAALLLSIGMAVDSNILIFSRLQEELQAGKTLNQARELSFGRAWDSIRDANVITIMIAVILINPFDFSFLNSSGMIRGFGITLLIGVIVGLFTGIFVSRNFMRIWIREKEEKETSKS